ncbi:MAG TPA: adenine deaminase, partial [Acidilobales archaeon]|nr:adenine deaminase [Acidilobales archaeon]
STKKANTVIKKIREVNRAAHSLGCSLEKPFMQLSFITLPTVPELGLTDKGLIDSKRYKLVNPVIALT